MVEGYKPVGDDDGNNLGNKNFQVSKSFQEDFQSSKSFQEDWKSSETFISNFHQMETVSIDTIKQAIIRVVGKDIVDRPYKIMPFYVLLLENRELSAQELKELVERYAEKLNIDLSQSSLKYAMTAVNKSTAVWKRKDDVTGMMYYKITDKAKMDILKAYGLITEAKKATITVEQAGTIEGMTAKFVEFFGVYGVDEGEPVYIEKLKDLLAVKGGRSLEVDYHHLNAFLPDIAERLITKPDVVIQAAEVAVRQVLQEDLGVTENIPDIHVRFFNLPTSTIPRKVGADHLNRLIQVEGVISRVSEVKPFVRKAVYVCADCGHQMVRIQNPYSAYMKRPAKCEACGSREIRLDDELSTFINYQTVRIQDAPEALRGGQMPRFLDVVLLDDLVDLVQPGDRVILTGVLRRVEEKVEKKPVIRRVLIANHVKAVDRGFDDVEITREDERRIREEAKKPDFKLRFVHSIAPNLYGLERIKEGIALSLVGGIGERPDGKKMRDAIHVLLVGDPGKGKSELLEFLRRVAPRAVLASAEGITQAGFTAAAVKDELTGEWVLEAGVMVLADKGFSLLDEFEKMKEHDRNAIHRAMEQGTVEVHKAGINATLNARTTVIAAANPVSGRWNFNDDIAKQINLPPTILSRFDLIFPVMDEPDPKEDGELADNVLGLGDQAKIIPYDEEFIRKFVAYARRNVHPRLTREAAELLRDYYVKLRSKAKREGGYFKIPITPRQLEALIRLTTAHARLHLRDTATVEDAKAAIEILEYSLRELLPPNEREDLDVNVLFVGKTTRELSIQDEVINAVKTLDDGEGAPSSAIITLLTEKGISEKNIRDVLKELKERGDITLLYSKGGVDFYRLRPR